MVSHTIKLETRNIMSEVFNVGDLRTLCFEINGRSIEDVTSNYSNKPQAILDIMNHYESRGMFDDLLSTIGHLRPKTVPQLNQIREQMGLQAMQEVKQEETPSETAVNAPNLVQEMRQHALAILSLCEQLEQAGSK